MTKKLPAYGFDMMNRFQCIGDACSDHCCWQWDIPLDDQDAQLLETKFPDEVFWEMRQNTEKNDSKEILKKLRFNKTEKSCHFLEAGWCRIHRDLGEEYLPKPCAAFPRNFNIFNEHFEMTGDLACPEVTRQLLFEEDALKWVPLKEINLPHFLHKSIKQQSQRIKPDEAVSDFRTFAQNLFQHKSVPLRSKLFCLLYLTRQNKGQAGYWQTCSKDFKDETQVARKLRRYEVHPLKREAFPENYWAPIYMALTFISGAKQRMFASRVFFEAIECLGLKEIPKEGEYDQFYENYADKRSKLSESRHQLIQYALHRFWLVCLQNSKAVCVGTFDYFAKEIIFHTLNLRVLMIAKFQKLESEDHQIDLQLLAQTLQQYWKSLGHNSQRLKYLVKAMGEFGFSDLDGYRSLLAIW